MKLGLCCVYFYGPDSGWLLDLQLRYIASTLAGYDYTVYAAANRLQPELRRTLEATPHVRIVSLPQYEGNAVDEPWMEASFEHAFYLDLLLREAADDGCTHLAAVDSDSFPVLPDWPNVLLQRMGSIRFAGVLRSENLDTNLPHPSGLFMDRSFLLEHAPRLLPPRSEILSNASFREFLKETCPTNRYGHRLRTRPLGIEGAMASAPTLQPAQSSLSHGRDIWRCLFPSGGIVSPTVVLL